MGLELLAVHGGLNPPMPKSHYFPTRPSIEYLQQNIGNDRMVGLRDSFRVNIPIIYGVADIRSGNPMQPAALRYLTHPLRKNINNKAFVVPDHPIYDLLGVRCVVTDPGVELQAPLARVFEGNTWVYERKGVLPRLFCPNPPSPQQARSGGPKPPRSPTSARPRCSSTRRPGRTPGRRRARRARS